MGVTMRKRPPIMILQHCSVNTRLCLDLAIVT
jgi:hypothetical protein